MFETKVVIFQVDIEIRQDQPLADPLPNDTRHFVAIELDDWIFDLDFCHGFSGFPLRWIYAAAAP